MINISPLFRGTSIFFSGVLCCAFLPFFLTNYNALQKPLQTDKPAGRFLAPGNSSSQDVINTGESIEQLRQSAWYQQTLKNLRAMNLPDTGASWSAESNEAGAHLGNPVATAGDVNGDGYTDVMIGALNHLPHVYGITGSVFVYYGSNKGLSDTVSTIISLPGSQLIFRTFGITIACVGDVNGDGYDDVLIGDKDADRYRSEAYLFYGSASGLRSTYGWSRSYNHQSFIGSIKVAAAGDVNADGFSDVIIGVYMIDYPDPTGPFSLATTIYRTFLYYGSASGLTGSWMIEGFNASSSVAGAGDVNHDGYDDVLIATTSGRVKLYFGSSTGLGTIAAWTTQGDQSAGGFGGSMACAGDVNNDGYSDVIISDAQWTDSTGPVVKGAGRVYLYLGSSSGLNNTPAWTVEGKQTNENFGISVAGAGDVNKDGYADIIVGVNQYTNGDTLEGAAFIYKGSATAPAKQPAWILEGSQANALFGKSVAGAGDVNHDSIDDFIVGAPGYSHGQAGEGGAFVYFGTAEVTLPLHLLRFNAQLTGNKTTLYWATSNETGTRYFEAQRSADGKNFQPVTRVDCKATQDGSFYTITDEYPFSGTMYYRLKMVNADQQFTYSNIVMLRNTKEELWEISPTLLKRGQSYNLGINNTEDKKQVTLQIIDINGRIQFQQNLVLAKGYQTFSQHVDMPTGYYIIRLTGLTKEGTTKKILVQ